MTIGKLHKILGDAIASGHARKAVMIDKSTFRHPLEQDGCTIMPINEAEINAFYLSDDDGGTKVTSRGAECTQTAMVIYGDDRERNRDLP